MKNLTTLRLEALCVFYYNAAYNISESLLVEIDEIQGEIEAGKGLGIYNKKYYQGLKDQFTKLCIYLNKIPNLDKQENFDIDKLIKNRNFIDEFIF